MRGVTWLCGDIGGTNVRLATFDGRLGPEWERPSGGFADLGAAVRTFLAETGARPVAACLGLAGPVAGNRCVTTNLPWVVDGAALGAALGFPVTLVNDFWAAARGVGGLGAPDVVQVGGTAPVAGAPVAVIGAGTGLGEALLVGDTVVPGEGGHAEFGPGTAREVAFAGWLVERYGRASWEHVLSGPGLVNLARFGCFERGEAAPDWLDGPDAPARVGRQWPEVLAWFAELYGAEAGNAALRSLARGGVYLAGGIAPRLLPELGAGGFRRRFEAKGPLGAAIADIPVFVVTHPALGLLGAARELQLAEARCAIGT